MVPATTLQTCIVHLIRNSFEYPGWKDRKALAAALRPIYAAPSAVTALAALDAFEAAAWRQKFPTVVAAWRRSWDRVIPFFAFPPEIRRVIHTTSAIENVNARLREIIKPRGHFPGDDAASKLIWLALCNITADWGGATQHWKEAMNHFAIHYAERFTCDAWRIVARVATARPLLCRSVASCSAVSNCGSSPSSPPRRGCAWLRSRRCAANLTGLARDRRGYGRSERRNRRLDRTKEQIVSPGVV